MTEVRDLRALVVDDEPMLLITLAANLELAGFDVVRASDPCVALDAVKTQPFDLVLSDIKMPGMDGVQLYREIRRFDADLPVVLMTAFAVESLVDQAIREGVYTVVTKPFDVDSLVSALGRAARRPAVLVVDETSEAGIVLADELARAGVHCRVVSRPDDAVGAAAGGTVDVCLLDANAASSVTTIERLRAIEPDMPVIGLEGPTGPSHVRALYERGAFACLKHPIDLASLLSLLAKARADTPRPRSHGVLR